MKKTLKTLINTGLFMLCFSHSHGLAMVYNLNDVLNQTGSASTEILNSTTHPGFTGIDDTFDGSVTFNFTITFGQFYPSAENAIFALNKTLNNNGVAFTGIGGFFIGNWSGMPADTGGFGNIDLGSNPIVAGVSQAFTMTIDYNAGALDTGTVVLAGDSTVYNLVDYDYSFTQIRFTTVTQNSSLASATNMSVSIVPEPATYALLSGALVLVFVALRRRFKA